MNWSTSSDSTDYYAGEGPGEGPAPGYDRVRSGNAQLIRIEHGINAQRSTTGAEGTRQTARVGDVRELQSYLDARPEPVVLTGDFYESVDLVEGGPTESTIRALGEFMTRHHRGPGSAERRVPERGYAWGVGADVGIGLRQPGETP